MGQGSTSRSTSQENEPEQPANLVITTTSLNKLTSIMTSPSAHYINIDECDQASENSSLMSLNNDQRVLLSSGSTSDQIGNLSFLLILNSRENFWQIFWLLFSMLDRNFLFVSFSEFFSKAFQSFLFFFINFTSSFVNFWDKLEPIERLAWTKLESLGLKNIVWSE